TRELTAEQIFAVLRSDDRGQKAEEERSRKTEGGGQMAEGGSLKAEASTKPSSGIRPQTSAHQASDLRHPTSEAPASDSLTSDSPTSGLRFSTDEAVLKRCRFIIVTVPTPIDEYK